MKISENSAEELAVPADQGAPRWPVSSRPVAPWWHTALVIAILFGVSALSTAEGKSVGFGRHHLEKYALTTAWEIALAALTWWGIRMRRVPMRQLLGERRPGARAWLADLGAALIFWVMAWTILAAISSLLWMLHLRRETATVMALAPQTIGETLLWVALSITAGVVEEFVFRGYLLQQFSSIKGRLWIGVLASSLIFGLGHGYEGIASMIAIVAYGAMFCALAVQRRSLRAGMMAHAWHDAATGILLAVAKHLHVI